MDPNIQALVQLINAMLEHSPPATREVLGALVKQQLDAIQAKLPAPPPRPVATP